MFDLVGSNYARKKRLQCQAALYAGANGKTAYIPHLQALAADEHPALQQYAGWALSVLLT